MFGRRILGGQPDGFKLLLGYQVRLPPHHRCMHRHSAPCAAALSLCAAQVASLLTPTAASALGRSLPHLSEEAHPQHSGREPPPSEGGAQEAGGGGPLELHSALSSLNEATFETAQVLAATMSFCCTCACTWALNHPSTSIYSHRPWPQRHACLAALFLQAGVAGARF